MRFQKASQAESCRLGPVAVQLTARSAGKHVNRWAENSNDEAGSCQRTQGGLKKNHTTRKINGIMLDLYYKTAVIMQVVSHSQTFDLRHNVWSQVPPTYDRHEKLS